MATKVELDRNGRLLIKPPLREHAGLDGSVVWVGQGRYIELWEPARWRARIEEAIRDRNLLRRGFRDLMRGKE